jgi:hypothetical protein
MGAGSRCDCGTGEVGLFLRYETQRGIAFAGASGATRVSLTKRRGVGKIERPRNTARMRFSPQHPADSVPEWRNWQTR